MCYVVTKPIQINAHAHKNQPVLKHLLLILFFFAELGNQSVGLVTKSTGTDAQELPY